MDPPNASDLIAQFCAITNQAPDVARQALSQRNWEIEEAVEQYFHPQAEEEDDLYDDDAPPAQASHPTPAQPQPATSSSNAQGKAKATGGQKPKQMTLDDLKKKEEASEDEDEDKGPDMFAGGEKSGLAVQNPGQSGGPVDHFKNIMNQAKANRDRPTNPNDEGAEPAQQGPSNFAGRAQTLGGDEAESQVIEDPAAMQRAREQTLQRVTRTLHLWADGVSIDDGPLFRFDDPANQGIMAEINRGRAPLALLDVQPDQEVDLNLEPHKDENYVQPKKQWKPFGGEGQRLGSPVPSAGNVTAPATANTATTSSSTAAQSSSSTAKPNVDESAPTIQLQIRLGDGTRLSSRFNTTHTIGDVYAFVDAASPASTQRAYALMTTFPSKELEDRSVVLGDMGEFKRGGVVVQKWK